MLYNRSAAVAYAKKWAYGRNPDYYDFQNLGGDCTNFASQVLFAGCGIMNYTPIFGWYYISLNDRAPAWTGVNELYRFLVNNTERGPQGQEVTLSEIEEGDIIQLKFKDGSGFDHSPVVVQKGDNILLAAHSRDVDCRPLSDYPYIALRPIHIYNVGE